VEELVWVKTNQLQRIIRTGRTGHWLNHSKEHCLVGVKGNPAANKHIHCDVIVSEVRETSRKPDEVYSIIEQLSPDSRKLELFGRRHNTRPGWLTIGNQLESHNVFEPDLRLRLEKAGFLEPEPAKPEDATEKHPEKIEAAGSVRAASPSHHT